MLLTPHDLRRTLTTTLAEAWDEEVDRPVADDAVIQAIRGKKLVGVEAHYNHAKMIRNKRRVLNWWNEWCDSLIEEKVTS